MKREKPGLGRWLVCEAARNEGEKELVGIRRKEKKRKEERRKREDGDGGSPVTRARRQLGWARRPK